MTLQKGQRKVKVKTIDLVHNYMIYGVHKMIPIIMVQCVKSKFFVTLQKRSKSKQLGLVHNFILLHVANCWTMIEGKCQMVQWVMVLKTFQSILKFWKQIGIVKLCFNKEKHLILKRNWKSKNISSINHWEIEESN